MPGPTISSEVELRGDLHERPLLRGLQVQRADVAAQCAQFKGRSLRLHRSLRAQLGQRHDLQPSHREAPPRGGVHQGLAIDLQPLLRAGVVRFLESGDALEPVHGSPLSCHDAIFSHRPLAERVPVRCLAASPAWRRV
jgi:hypothetical protein